MRIVILGAGALGRVTAEIVRRAGLHEVAGFLDDNPQRPASVNGVAVLGDSGQLRRLAEEGAAQGAAVALGQGTLRLEKARMALEAGLMLPVICDASAIVSPTAKIGEGCIVGPGAIIGPGVRIGRLTVVGTAAIIEHDAVIEDACLIGPRSLVDARAHLAAGCRLGGGDRVAQDARLH